ncbi:tyrosine-type recombinase/integrase [Microbacterium sp. P02]|uniref:tyrosine-type recombinase/integrase n=1 Tax=Microbacterium sp. P02 TaxID=3366260 RepID=UPI0036730FE9
MPKRRDHGQGALYELKARGLWRGVVDNGYTPDGRRRQRYVHAKTREDCAKKLRRLMQEIAEHGGPLDHHTRVSELADLWLADAGDRLKPKTMQGYRSHIATNIVPLLGNRVVADLKPSDVRRLHSAVFARKVGPATVAGAHRTLSALLSYAVDEGLISRNVAESVDMPRQAPSHRDSLTRAEAEALLSAGDPRWMLALLSGARDGEIRALRTSDLDLDRGMAHISWNLAEVTSRHGCGGTCGHVRAGTCPQRVLDIAPNLEARELEGRWVAVRPKSSQPRHAPLTPELISLLRAHLDAADGANPHDLVWHRADGKPLSNTDSNIAFRAALEGAGINRPATVHWLRHTYTTMAEHAGIPWVVYSRISGHGSEDISRRYTHQLEQESQDGVAALEAFLRTS